MQLIASQTNMNSDINRVWRLAYKFQYADMLVVRYCGSFYIISRQIIIDFNNALNNLI